MRAFLGALLLIMLAACSTTTPQTQSPPTTTTIATLGPQQACTQVVEYWANEFLSGRKPGLDYQEMALSGEEYEALRALVDEAAELKPLPAGWVHEQAAARCQEVVRIQASRAAAASATQPSPR